MTFVRSPIRYDGRPLDIGSPPSVLGENTLDILQAELDLDPATLEDLQTRGKIRQST